jgi:hypothetical protein
MIALRQFLETGGRLLNISNGIHPLPLVDHMRVRGRETLALEKKRLCQLSKVLGDEDEVSEVWGRALRPTSDPELGWNFGAVRGFLLSHL